MEEVVYCSTRRCLAYPLYRHWQLVQRVLEDTTQLFLLGNLPHAALSVCTVAIGRELSMPTLTHTRTKGTPKRDNLPAIEWTHCSHLYVSEEGRTNNAQNACTSTCPLFGGSTVPRALTVSPAYCVQ